MKAYAQCTECELPFYRKSEFIIPAFALSFLAGFIAAEAIDGP